MYSSSSSASSSPSPTLPLMILGVVMVLVVGPWLLSYDSEALEEAASAGGRLASMEFLVLVPVVLLILFQFYGSYDGQRVQVKLPRLTLSDSAAALVALVALVVVLLWARSSVMDILRSL